MPFDVTVLEGATLDGFFDLRYTGGWTSTSSIQYYDVAQALVGFERTISLTAHLLLNGEVITQSPSAKGFQLLALPAQEGSWKWTVGLALTLGQVAHAFGTAPPDTAFGWLTKSAVEYVIQETLGFSPNFEETLGKQISDYRKAHNRTQISKDLSIERFDSLLEKTESGIKALHRPIVKSESANTVQFAFRSGARSEILDVYGNVETYSYIDEVVTSEDFSKYCGSISSYNANTFKGRIYMQEEQRTIPFELAKEVRTARNIKLITESLSENATSRALMEESNHRVCFEALRNETKSGRLKSIFVVQLVG